MRKLVAVLTTISFVSFCALLSVYIYALSITGDTSAPGTDSGFVYIAKEPDLLSFPEADTDEPGPADDEPDDTDAEPQRELAQSVYIENVPYIPQYPELPRGCEVTALASLLNFYGIPADKMTLAKEIKKDETPRRIENGRTYWGNPHNGFIGDMYNMQRPGYGVYHEPVYDLLSAYVKDAAYDMTGCEFDEIYHILNDGMPVWVIINATYAPLRPADFVIWHTPDGEIEITYRMHAVLIIGYDEEKIYLCDPLSGHIYTEKTAFIACWEQMGRQAVTIIP